MSHPSAAFLVIAASVVSASESSAQSSTATRTVTGDDEQQAAIAVVLAHEQAVQTYDFDKIDSLHTTDYRGIEESYPQPRRRPQYVEDFKPMKDAVRCSP
jgi:hypothetical protein